MPRRDNRPRRKTFPVGTPTPSPPGRSRRIGRNWRAGRNRRVGRLRMAGAWCRIGPRHVVGGVDEVPASGSRRVLTQWSATYRLECLSTWLGLSGIRGRAGSVGLTGWVGGYEVRLRAVSHGRPFRSRRRIVGLFQVRVVVSGEAMAAGVPTGKVFQQGRLSRRGISPPSFRRAAWAGCVGTCQWLTAARLRSAPRPPRRPGPDDCG